MNKNFYKTIFSKTRGEMVVVAENVSAEGQTSNRNTTDVEISTESTAEKNLGLKVLSFSIMLLTGVASFGMTTDLAQANVIADPNAAGNQRPTIINSANGTTQVNIQTPSQAGISMNQYQQFDVNQNGVILNNSRQNAQTQLGGYIQGNPWLAGGEAKVIVNQVNSTNASHLNGYIEVGGRKADVIIANPTGINVDGGGFINAGAVTLSTGNPLLNNGAVTGFQVRDGLINITGQGLDTSTADYTRLLSHAAQINAGVWAKDLQIVTGQNDIDAQSNIKSIGNASSGTTNNTPKFAIDTGSLGGMYAGKISLISTEKGVGINNAGQMFASAGSIKISADGQLQNSGAVVSQHKENPQQATLDIQATELNNSGSISSLGKQSIQTINLNNTGLIATSAELNIRNKETIQNHGELNAGRVDLETKDLKNSSGKVVQTGLQDLAIDAKTLNNKNKGLIGYTEIDQDTGTNPSTGTGGGNTGGSGAETEAPSTATGGGSTSSANTSITASFAQGKIKADSIENDAGKITANGGVSLTLNQGLDNSGATLNLNTLNVEGQHLKNNHGVITAQDARVKTKDVDNTTGKIQVAQYLTTESEQLKNTQGQILTGKTLSIRTGDLNNNEGELLSSQDSDIQANDIQNTAGKILANQNVAIDAKSITADGQLSAGNDLKLKLKDSFTTKNKIEAGNNLKIETVGNLVNTTELQAGSKVELKAKDIDNKDTGRIIANNGTHIHSENLTNRGEINSNGQTLVELTSTLNNIGTGRIYGEHVAISANKVLNQEETVDETKAAVIAARERLDLAAKDIVNKENALISSEGNMVIAGTLDENKHAVGQAQSINNNSAKIEAGTDLTISSQLLRNTNEHLQTQIEEVDRQYIVEYEAQGQNHRYAEGSQAELGWSTQFDESEHLVTPNGQWHENWHRYNYEKIKDQTQVVNSAPGQILAGGNIKITGDVLLNSDSQILAGGLLDVKVGDLDNHETLGQTIIRDEGTLTNFWRDHKKGTDVTGSNTSVYRPAPMITDLNLGVLSYQEHVQGLSTTNPNTQLNIDSTLENDITVRTIDVNTSLPSSSLFNTNPANPEYLIETDPAFTNYKKWLGSDYMLKLLSLDPQNLHKRLGDGYYEQKITTEQVSQLTGRRFLDGFNSSEEQFQQLMLNGVTTAQQMQLKVGIALSAEQIANLTSDIVWLVEKQVTLNDGRVETVLAPQVYVRLQTGDINGNGALLAGSNSALNVENSLVNSGTIAGRNALVIQADGIQNIGGRLTADQLSAKAKKDINNLSGTIDAKQKLFLDAGENINIVTETNTTQNNQGSNTHLNRQAGVYITAKDGQSILSLNAGKDIQLNAGVISNASEEGITQLTAKNNINLGTTQVSQKQENIKDSNNYIKRSESGEIGSQIQANNDIQLNAGNDINLRASEVNSVTGNVIAQGQNINIESGEYTKTADDALKTKSKGIASSTTRVFKDSSEQIQAVASVIGGDNIYLDAEKDISVKGSHVIADQDTNLSAKNNVKVESALTQSSEEHFYSKKKSGLFSSGGIGVTVGQIKESTDNNNQQFTSNASSVGSLAGHTNITAGNTYQQTGSTVLAQEGDVNILAQRVNIEAANEQNTNDYRREMEQKGLTLAVNVPIVQQVEAVLDSSKQVGQSKNDRVNAMAAANAGFDTYKAGQSIGKLKDVLAGTAALNQSVEVGVSLTYGEQKSVETNHTQSNTAAQSKVSAGGATNIVATGAGKDSNINIIGSDVIGLKGTHLVADNDVNIKAAEQKTIEESNNKSSGWNAGVSISNQTGLGVTAGGNLGKGKGDGTDTSYVNSHVGSKDSLTTISSGNATNIIGGQVQGKGVQIDANELNIESLQDTATYKSKQQDISGQFSVGTNGGNVSGSFSKSNVDANYASVNEQSGIFAGDDGYQINVKNNTDLKGAIITSTQQAEDLNKNSLDTGTLTYSNIQNNSEYDAKGISLSAGLNATKSDQGKPGTVISAPEKIDQHASTIQGVSKSIGFGLDSDKDSSVTQSGINTSNITIRETVRQEELTGNSAEQIKSEILTNVTTDTARENSGALQNNFDKDQVKSEINLQMDVTKKFDANRQEVRTEINKNLDEAKKAKEAGTLSQAEFDKKQQQLQTLGILVDSISAGLSAPTSSGLGIAAATVSPKLSYEIGQYFKSNNSEGSAAHILAHTVLGAAVAAAGGNDALLAGVSAGGAEASAPLLSKYLYGKEAKDLTADEKGTVSAITSLVASGVGASTGDVASSVQSGQSAQNAVENNGLENVLLPHEIDEIQNDHKGEIPKRTLQAIKDNTTYKINENGEFILCVKVAGDSCAPRQGERYATTQEIAQKGGESLLTMAAGYGAGKVVEPVVLSISKSGVVSKINDVTKALFISKINRKDLEYLKANNIKFSEKDLISTIRAPDGKVVFLEKGNEKAGLLHVLKEHQKNFEDIGVQVGDIPNVLMDAIKKGKIVGYQGKGKGRPIYETEIKGKKRGIAITIGNNGFIVGANPTRIK